MNLMENDIVWARHYSTNIYWPARIIHVSHRNDSSWIDSYSNQAISANYSYYVQYLRTEDSCWANDILPYHHYRDSMINDSFLQYGLHPSLKKGFLDAVKVADNDNHAKMFVSNPNDQFPLAQYQIEHNETSSTNSEIVETKSDHDFLSTPTLAIENSFDSSSSSQQTQSFMSDGTNFVLTTNQSTEPLETKNDNWYMQNGLLIESITPPLPTFTEAANLSQTFKMDQQQTDALIILTTRNYSAPDFLAYLMHSLVHFQQRSIVYLDDVFELQAQPNIHSNISNIIYLFCCDRFYPLLQQNLRTFIFDRRSVHLNYYFFILNAPCHQLIHDVFESIIDKRSMLVLQYHPSYDNESTLLCSGDRQTFESFHSSLLKYLCRKVKYIDGSMSRNGDQQISFSFGFSSMIQSGNSIHRLIDEQIKQTIEQKFDSNFLLENAATIDELFPTSMAKKSSHETISVNAVGLQNDVTSEQYALSAQRIDDLFASGLVSENRQLPIWKYFQQNNRE